MIVHKLPFLNADFDIDPKIAQTVNEKFKNKEKLSKQETKEFESPVKIKLNFGDIEGHVQQMEITLNDARNVVMSLIIGMAELGDATAIDLHNRLANSNKPSIDE